MNVTLSVLVACGLHPTQARVFEAPMALACAAFNIDTSARIAAFVAQAAVESTTFTRLEEDLHYRTPERLRDVFSTRVRNLALAAELCKAGPEDIGCHVYAGVNGNGDKESGDGWRYRGRGIFQLTGRLRYREADAALGQPYELQPELVATPEHAAMTAAHYWHQVHGNELADAWHIDELTRRINGPAMLHADVRRSRADNAVRALA